MGHCQPGLTGPVSGFHRASVARRRRLAGCQVAVLHLQPLLRPSDPKPSPEAQGASCGRGPSAERKSWGLRVEFPEAQGGGRVVPSPPGPGDRHLPQAPAYGVSPPTCLGVPPGQAAGNRDPWGLHGCWGPQRWAGLSHRPGRLWVLRL